MTATSVRASGYTDNFAYEATTPIERVSALCLAATLVGGSACIAAVARIRLAAVPSFILLVEAFTIVALLLTGSMLFAQYRARRYAPLVPLALAFATCGAMHVGYILTFPGVFAPSGLLGAGSQSTSWAYVGARFAFDTLVLTFVFCEWSERRGAAWRAALVTAIARAAGVLTVFVLLAVTLWNRWLPILILTNNHYSPFYLGVIQPALLLLPLVGAVGLIAVCGLETRVGVWLAVTLLASFLEVGTSGVLSNERFSLGWYWARLDLAVSAILFIVAMQVQLAGILSRAARANERSHALFEVVSREATSGRTAVDPMLANVRRDLDFEWAFFARIDDGRVSIEASDGTTPYAEDPRVRLETTLLQAVTGRELFVLEDGAGESAGFWSAFVSVPIFVDGRLYGSAGFASRRRRRNPIDDGDRNFIYMFGILLGSTIERENRAKHLAGLAFFDTLTGLPNRALFMSRLREELGAGKRYERRLAVHFLDLDKFKGINDRYGHAVGDEVLHAFAERLRVCVRDGDTVARLGGDEFVVLQQIATSFDEGDNLARRIATTCDRNLPTSAGLLDVGVSVGTAYYPRDGDDGSTLLAKADAAQYQVKRARATPGVRAAVVPLKRVAH